MALDEPTKESSVDSATAKGFWGGLKISRPRGDRVLSSTAPVDHSRNGGVVLGSGLVTVIAGTDEDSGWVRGAVFWEGVV